jgi:hypothetical protein
LSRDPWEGDELRPLTLNGWGYVEGNPINRIDPIGLCGADWTLEATRDCIRLARRLEELYGIIVYWPGRKDLPPEIDNSITCFCGDEFANEHAGLGCDRFPHYFPYQDTKYKKWKRKELMALAIAILMYEREIGYNATWEMMRGVIFVRANRSPTDAGFLWLFPEVSGQYFSNTNASQIPSLPGFGGKPGIALYNPAHRYDWANLGVHTFSPETTWTFVHEIAHRVDDFMENKGLKDLSTDFAANIWKGYGNPGTGPTSYARNADWAGEDMAETMTAYLWNRHSSSWTEPGSEPDLPWIGRREIDILWNFRNPASYHLDNPRTQFVEDVFNILRNRYR